VIDNYREGKKKENKEKKKIKPLLDNYREEESTIKPLLVLCEYFSSRFWNILQYFRKYSSTPFMPDNKYCS
jgi:uncharacterized protein YllA (UPF0747 family)